MLSVSLMFDSVNATLATGCVMFFAVGYYFLNKEEVEKPKQPEAIEQDLKAQNEMKCPFMRKKTIDDSNSDNDSDSGRSDDSIGPWTEERRAKVRDFEERMKKNGVNMRELARLFGCPYEDMPKSEDTSATDGIGCDNWKDDLLAEWQQK